MTKNIDIKKVLWIYLFAFLLAAFSFRADAAETKTKAKADAKEKQTIATFETSKGTFKVKLYTDVAPKTVENFVGLANGTKEWTDPKTGKKVKKPFYDGLTFHRIIKDFMIQGGDPLGNGTGDPGYKFDDEKSAMELKFDKPGYLAMANAGPNTNGSQFFVTTIPTTWLNGKHAIFGEVTEGMDVVHTIENSKTDSQQRPLEAVSIKHVKITK